MRKLQRIALIASLSFIASLALTAAGCGEEACHEDGEECGGGEGGTSSSSGGDAGTD